MDYLFQAFAQTQAGKEAQEGTGLGLVISRKFVELMRGQLSVSSQLNRGTIFRFNIPVEIAEAAEHFLEHPIIGIEPGQPACRILVVDDKATNRQLLVRLLAPLGFEMREASNGKEAIAVFDEWEPQLIWMDMRMPEMDGYEATKRIKTTTKGQATAIIALTASALEEQKAVILSAGCDDFIRKPFQEEEIFKAIQKHIGIRYVYAESLHASAQSESGEAALPMQELTTHLGLLPSTLASSLSQALRNVDPDSITSVISDIEQLDPSLASTEILHQFQQGVAKEGKI